MIEIINGNALLQKGDILLHQTNCLGIMGGGIALQIRKKYPNVFERYQELCASNKPEALLGTCQIVWFKEKYMENVIGVANLFGQLEIGGKRATNYEAFARGLENLNSQLCNDAGGCRIIVPYEIGCGLGGGNWNIILPMIEYYLKDHEVVICKLS